MHDWTHTFQPFQIVGNLHYVGTTRVASYLLTTPAGHILIDSGFEANVPQLRKNIESLGFRFEDIRLLLSSRADVEHVQAHALVRRMTGARVVSSAGDAPSIETGGKRYWAYGDSYSWPPCPVDQVVADGESVSLGGTVLAAYVTPGHSRGATTWTTTIGGRSNDGGTRPLAIVFYPGSNTPPGAPLADHSAFGKAVSAYKHSLGTWKSLPCDVFLGSYGETFGLERKWRGLRRGMIAPFVDPDGYERTIAEAERKFELQIERDR